MESHFLYNNKKMFSYRKELRDNLTEVEKILWSRIKNKQIANTKFFRQHSVGPYILDLYCPKARLAIELDGSQHGEKENVLYDEDRTDYLKQVNIKIMRFWNDKILKDLNGVLNAIESELHT